jgi:hypothetical protein
MVMGKLRIIQEYRATALVSVLLKWQQRYSASAGTTQAAKQK